MTPEQRKTAIEKMRKAGRKGGRTTKRRIKEGKLPADHYKSAGAKGGASTRKLWKKV